MAPRGVKAGGVARMRRCLWCGERAREQSPPNDLSDRLDTLLCRDCFFSLFTSGSARHRWDSMVWHCGNESWLVVGPRQPVYD